MHIYRKISTSIAVTVVLSGCNTTHFSERFTYDTTVRNVPGTITLSDPKLYTREALISERARDIKWINKLITESEDSTKVQFKPELVREVEQITAMAAAIGLKFDPAAGLAYRRDKQTSDIQHEIDLSKLQLQLDQLKRDIELLRAGFASQSTIVNEGINKLGDAAAASSNPTISVSATDQLKAAIDKLNAALIERLDEDGKLPKETIVTSSPFDDFRDRSAYRDMLKAAQNAAELDQLHDFQNSRLIRLNFQASVIPDPKNLQSLGAIQLKISPPDPNNPETQRFFRQWLQYINTNNDYRKEKEPGKLNIYNPVINDLLLSESFEMVNVLGIELLLPVLIDANDKTQRPMNIYRRSELEPQGSTAETKHENNLQTAINTLNSAHTNQTAQILSDLCSKTQLVSSISDPIGLSLQVANGRRISKDYIQLAETVANQLMNSSVLTETITSKIVNANTLSNKTLQLMEEKTECQAYLTKFKQLTWKIFSDPAIVGNNEVRIYEIGPREQVQQVSTVVRSASSLALAASIATSNPSSGVGAEGAANYSKQAMGRATALERVPAVVGYSQAGKNSFGWVLGPRAVLNPKGRIDMAQLLKTYDLSVDMSVPGWWPMLNLESTTAWAPAPTLIAAGMLLPIQDKSKQDQSDFFNIPVVRNSVDEFDSLTQYLARQNTSVEIKNVAGGLINACEKSNLLITGKNIWRAKQVFVLGQALGTDNITITADMKGILVSVPAITPVAQGDIDNNLYVITPLGNAKIDISQRYTKEPSGAACKPKAATDETAKDTVSVTQITPSVFSVPSSVDFTFKGTNLDKVGAVHLEGQAAKSAVSEDKGTILKVKFDESNTKSVRASDSTLLEFFEKDEATGKPTNKVLLTKYVRTQRIK